ncbi:unnamed protein product [Rhizoctonia solani]|uniref:C2H2-type domain-containing protein n=1 Tax=Rhizoctonia solani TaxID=456999 RepID=A0A8H2XUC7_9AGAM|nr:unnamed protein product [Rhizoctonia solani]
MSAKRRRHSTLSSNEPGLAESWNEDQDLETTHPDGKLPRTSEIPGSRSLVCSLPPTCAPPRHPTTLGSLRDLEEHYKKYHTHTCQEGNCRNEPGGAKIFPDARMLELHQNEYHDELVMIKNERGESIFACFLESCPKKFRTPKGRRLHLIDAHGYPKLFFFAVTKHGVGGLLARYGEGATLIRNPWKPRPGNSSVPKNDNDSDEELQNSPRLKDTGSQSTTLLEAKTAPRSSTPQPREGLDDLASSMKNLSLVPTNIRFGRGARRAGFTGYPSTYPCSLLWFFNIELGLMPRLVSTQTKRFKKWLLRFKTGKSARYHSTGVEVLPVEAHFKPAHVPVPAWASGGTPAGAKEDSVISPSTTSPDVIKARATKDVQRSR